MLHDIEPHNLNNNYSPRQAKADDTVLYFSGRDFMMAEDGFPVKAMYPDDAVLTYLFEYDGKAVYLSDRGPLRDCHTEQQAMIRSFEQPVTFMLATAKHLWSWYSKSRFCGCCGSENIHSLTERAMVCPK